MTFIIENWSWSFYFYMSFVSVFVVMDENKKDWAVAIFGGLLWPVFYPVRILRKVNKLLNTKEKF